MKPDQVPTKARPAYLREALLPVTALVGLIYLSVVVFETSAHIALILSTLVAGLVGWRIGHTWQSLEEGMVHGISVGLKAILILMVIGMLIATWILSGIVPIMIYYGLQLLSPSYFLTAACLICAIVSISTGSSWTTAGTVGVALIGVGQGLNVPPPMVAGAIISGAYFGDKLSPLSDTTNLAPAVAGSELFEHVRYMLQTTVPALIMALTLYTLMGFNLANQAAAPDAQGVALIRSTLAENYDFNPLLLLPPLLVIAMVVFKLPALPALLGGVLLGGLLAFFIQGASMGQIFLAAYDGFVSETGVEAVDDLLSRGGLSDMMGTVALILCALSFGGVMERSGLLSTLAGTILKFARNTGQLVGTTILTCFGMNVLAPDQYLSIVVPGRMYKSAYEKHGLEPRLLSRTLEDAGTLSSPLVAWNTCGAFMSGTLGVSALAYAPYAFLNLLTPVIALVIAVAGWGISRRPPPKESTVSS